MSILETKELRIREIYQFSQCQPLAEVGSEHRSLGLKISVFIPLARAAPFTRESFRKTTTYTFWATNRHSSLSDLHYA